MDFLALLPPELKTHILSYLTPSDLGRCTLVCRDWGYEVSESAVWRAVCHRAGFLVAQPQQLSCGRYYRNLYMYLQQRLHQLEVTLEPVKLGSTDGPLVGVAYSKGRVALVKESGRVKLWDAETMHSLGSISTQPDPKIFKFEGNVIAFGYSAGPIRSYDVSLGRPLAMYTGHTWGVVDIEVDTTHSRILAASGDHFIRLWSLRLARLLHVFSYDDRGRWVCAGLCFNPDTFTPGEGSYFIFWATSCSISIKKLSSADDCVLGSEAIAFLLNGITCQEVRIVGKRLIIINSQDAPRHVKNIYSHTLDFCAHAQNKSKCFSSDLDLYQGDNKAWSCNFSIGETYMTCFPRMNRCHGNLRGCFKDMLLYRLVKHRVQGSYTTCQTDFTTYTLEHVTKMALRSAEPEEEVSGLMSKVRSFVKRGFPSGYLKTSEVTFVGNADRKWMDGLNGSNDVGPFMVTLDHTETRTGSNKYSVYVYKWRHETDNLY